MAVELVEMVEKLMIISRKSFKIKMCVGIIAVE
jgi:hypothetical protein